MVKRQTWQGTTTGTSGTYMRKYLPTRSRHSRINFWIRVTKSTASTSHDSRCRNRYTSLCYCDLGGGEVNNASHRDHHENNTCIQASDVGTYASFRCEFAADNHTMPDCTNTTDPACTTHTEDPTQPYFAGNKVYNPSGKTSVCGMPLHAWQALGNDPRTTIYGPLPSTKEIAAMARSTLGLS